MNNCELLYKELFKRTRGFMLSWPLGSTMRIGDFFSIKEHNMDVIGNIYDSYFQLDITNTFAEDIYKFSSPLLEPFIKSDTKWEIYEPKAELWQLKHGCETTYKSKKMLDAHKRKMLPADINKYVTNLKHPGSYFFVANDVKYIRMPHFKEIHKEIIRRLTTEFYNFNKIFLITEVAMAADFSLGISHNNDAQFVISVDEYYGNEMPEIMDKERSFEVEEVRGLGHLKLRSKGGAIAFRAKKLELSLAAREVLTREIYRSSEKDIKKYAVELIDNELFHLFPKNDINPGNANEFFQWSDMDLNDVGLFLGSNIEE